MPITTIAFDLDDTLLDTSNILVPAASKHAFSILISNDLNMTLDECETRRIQAIKTISHKDLFHELALKHGTKKTQAAVELAIKAFYEPSIPNSLPLIENALETLEILSKKYHLYIVTAGFEAGQKNKIKSLGIDKFFKKTFVVNSLNGDRKIAAFRSILNTEGIHPKNLLCIGNSLSSEIKDAKELGAIACYFEFGEDRGKVSTDPAKKPDFHIKKYDQLITTCKI